MLNSPLNRISRKFIKSVNIDMRCSVGSLSTQEQKSFSTSSPEYSEICFSVIERSFMICCLFIVSSFVISF